MSPAPDAVHIRRVKTFYWSDLHFDHLRTAIDRGFATVQEHDDHIINAWTNAVAPEDTVWVLGDLTVRAPARTLEIMHHLPGTKHLILGNHDRAHPIHRASHRIHASYRSVFDSVNTAEQHIIGDRTVLLSHFPYEPDEFHGDRYSQWQPRNEGLWLIHGHVHSLWRTRGRQINVGVDHWMDGPVSATTLESLMAEAEMQAAA